MNIFNKVTLQSLKKNKTRTVVTIIGIILSAAMSSWDMPWQKAVRMNTSHTFIL